MNIVSGNTKLIDIYSSLQKTLFTHEKLLTNEKHITIQPQIKLKFLDNLFSKPLIFYVEKESLKNCLSNDNFENYAPYIFHSENIETLKFLNELSKSLMESISVDWIVIEAKRNVVVSSNLAKIVFFDYWQLRQGKRNTAGKIDYNYLEKYISESSTRYFGKSILKKFKRFITYPILGIKPLQYARYIEPKLKYINSPNDVAVTEDMCKNIYRYQCIICDKKYSIVLSKSKKKSTPSSFSMFKKKDNKVEFACDHEDTKYENIIRARFNLDKLNNFYLDSQESYDRLFLFLFDRFIKDKNTIKYVTVENITKEYAMEKFIEICSN